MNLLYQLSQVYGSCTILRLPTGSSVLQYIVNSHASYPTTKNVIECYLV